MKLCLLCTCLWAAIKVVWIVVMRANVTRVIACDCVLFARVARHSILFVLLDKD